MAKVKPATSRKIIKPQNQVAETAADEITTALDRLSDHLSKHLKTYLIGLVVICAAAAGINVFLEQQNDAAVERSDAASSVLAVTTDSIAQWGDTESLSGIPGLTPPTENAAPVKADHADAATQQAAVLKAVDEAAAKVTEDTAGVVALVQSTTSYAQGKYSESNEAFDKAVGFLGDNTSLQPLLLEKRGKLAEANGDVATAEDAYTKLSEMGSLYFKVRGLVLLGELKSTSDSAAAKAAYASALEQLVPAEGQLLPPSLRSLRSELTRRHAQL